MRTIAEIEADLKRVRAEGEHAFKKMNAWSIRREALRRDSVNLERELRLAQYPAEPVGAEAVKFYKRYRPASSRSPTTLHKSYSFVATKADGRYWLSGSQSPQGITWQQLVDFIKKDNVLPFGVVPLYQNIEPF